MSDTTAETPAEEAKAPAKKKTTTKKTAAKKAATKKAPAKKAAPKKAAAKKTSAAEEETAKAEAAPKKAATTRKAGRPAKSPEQKAADAAVRAAKKAAEEAKAARAAADELKNNPEAAAADQEARKKPGRPPKSLEQKAIDAEAKAERLADAAVEALKAVTAMSEAGASEAKTGDAVEAKEDKQAKKASRRRSRREVEAEAAEKADKAEKAEEAKDAEKPEGDGKDASAKPEEGKDRGEGEGKGKRRRNRRQRRGKEGRREIVPSATRDELANLADDELVAKALELKVDPTEYGERDDLVSAVYDALLQAEGFVEIAGILDLLPDGYGFIRTNGYLPGEHDVYVGASMVRRNGLRRGDYINGRVRPPRDNEKYPALNTITALNEEPFEGPTHRVKFAQLTPVYPDERLIMEHGHSALTARAIDLVAPIGKGQRGLIVSPPKAGKTTVLKDIAAAISANNPEVHLMCLLVDERPEEVTDMERSIDGEVISSTFDMPSESHIAVAELVIERAKRLVENGQDVVILLDSITRLARAYNLGTPASGRILSGGVDSSALYPPKRFLGAARNIEFGGSLTILGTALVDTGSKMDEVIFEEFKGTGNMELKLDRNLADRRIFPAIDPVASGTRKEELLLDPQEAPLIWGVRHLLANLNNTERAMDMLIKSLKQTDTNREMLIKSAKKANKTNVGVSSL